MIPYLLNRRSESYFFELLKMALRGGDLNSTQDPATTLGRADGRS